MAERQCLSCSHTLSKGTQPFGQPPPGEKGQVPALAPRWSSASLPWLSPEASSFIPFPPKQISPSKTAGGFSHLAVT